MTRLGGARPATAVVLCSRSRRFHGGWRRTISFLGGFSASARSSDATRSGRPLHDEPLRRRLDSDDGDGQSAAASFHGGDQLLDDSSDGELL
ncbi:hypothetical protein M6B38_275700 [Iris pallida]|uniref:Uncharacterized protein n=1 Tax=Iris pallida TaxID=29817 RepID=A0AAX6I6X9_IRIPA|nr:hypothetical protein M6B38_275700 [Iris pallida]